MAVINCPNCHGKLRFPDDSPPRRVKCTMCSHEFIAGPHGPTDGSVEKPAANAAFPPPPPLPPPAHETDDVVDDFEIVDDDEPAGSGSHHNRYRKRRDDDDDRDRDRKRRDDEDDRDRDRRQRDEDDEYRPRSRRRERDDDRGYRRSRYADDDFEDRPRKRKKMRPRSKAISFSIVDSIPLGYVFQTNLGTGIGIVFVFVWFAGKSPLIALLAVLAFMWGCAAYAKNKGYPEAFGLLGLLAFIGLLVLVLLPDEGR